jgi:tetratricopeptide (TPR) repeat protein
MYPLATGHKELQGYSSWLARLQNFGWLLVGKQDKSLDYWLKLLNQESDKPQFKAIHYLIEHQAFQEARDYLEGIIGRYQGKDGEIKFLIARCYYSQGLIQEALLILQDALEDSPEKWKYLELQADCLLEQGDWLGAVEALNKAIRANPKNAETIFRLGIIYSFHGEYLEALRCFQGCCELKPHRSSFWEMKGETHLKLEQIPQAEVCFEKALRNGMNPDLAARLAYCSVQMNNVKKGIRLYRMVLKHEPDHYDALCNLAAVYQNQGRSVEALNLQEKAYTLYKNDPILLNNMAYTMVHLGRSRKATEYYQEALQIAQGHPLILYNLSVCHVQKGNWDSGIETLEELLKIDHNHSEGWALLGNIYEQISEHELAIDCFNRALKLA